MPLAFDTTATGFSLPNAYFLAKASELAYSADPVADGAELGLQDVIRIFEVEGTFGFLCVTDEAVLLAFRGTVSIGNWLTDAMIRQAQLAPYPGLVHRGFAAALELVWAEVRAALPAALGGRTVWVTGHSLGAVLATLAACRLEAEGVPVQGAYTFGSPRVGNLEFYDGYTPATYRFVNNNDIVTHVPLELQLLSLDFYTYKHVGTLKYLDRHGRLGDGMSGWETKKQFLLELLVRRGGVPLQSVEDHRIANYVAAIATNL